ncbi:MAG: hypothetical protein LBS97_00420 [Treponema sp.]|jgi:GGDEF domain-containing protein|nr:hypothetical protein [Treponema sp.]
MKAKTVRNLSAALVCVFVFAVFILIGGIFYYYRQGLENAQKIFDALSSTDLIVPEGGAGLSEALTRKLDEQVALNENLVALSIRIGNKLVYANPYPGEFFTAGTNGIPELTSRRWTERIFTASTGRAGIISAAISVLNPAEIVKSAGIAFIMVFAATIAAIVLIVYIKLFPEKIRDTETEPLDTDGQATIVNMEDFNETAEPTLSGELDVLDDGETVGVDQDTDVFFPDAMPSPRGGFYSPETGFMREEYIGQVLDPALISAAPHNEDIALLIIRAAGIDRISSLGTELCALILERFKSKERIFEYRADGFAAIMLNTDVDTALEEAEALYVELTEKTAALDPPPEIGIGIATKAFRTTIAASRLLTEARQAIARALENPDTPIVAFKINPEKYREFMEQASPAYPI